MFCCLGHNGKAQQLPFKQSLWRCSVAIFCVFISNHRSELSQVGSVKLIVKHLSTKRTPLFLSVDYSGWDKMSFPPSIAISPSLFLQPVKFSQTQVCKILRFAVPPTRLLSQRGADQGNPDESFDSLLISPFLTTSLQRMRFMLCEDRQVKKRTCKLTLVFWEEKKINK